MGRRAAREDGSAGIPAPPPTIMDLLPFGVVVAGPDGRAQQANRAWRVLTGQMDGGWRDVGWFSVVPVGRRVQVRDDLLLDVRAGRTHEVDWVVHTPTNGGRRVLHLKATPAITDDEVTGMVVVATDVTAQQERIQDLVVRATRDPLTGLYNRAQFLDFVRHALDRQRREPHRR